MGLRAEPKGGRVAILGGGVAGLSAALELTEHGYSVTVFERHELGGKARSIRMPATGLPGEHGFRFFPSFYRNLTDTMRRIPFPGNRNGTCPSCSQSTGAQRCRRIHSYTSHQPEQTMPSSKCWTSEVLITHA
ncbi:FAD-dependent oxidoreductase [Kitasatospora sp. LaBMicrA B282]|uniref:FAD-dependent oxidoreductase n=1 Tax=Kitasatospora sp. LaBMicrA B282 TaxID=3420949 RepID=UPI003D13FFDC